VVTRGTSCSFAVVLVVDKVGFDQWDGVPLRAIKHPVGEGSVVPVETILHLDRPTPRLHYIIARADLICAIESYAWLINKANLNQYIIVVELKLQDAVFICLDILDCVELAVDIVNVREVAFSLFSFLILVASHVSFFDRLLISTTMVVW